MTTPTTAAGRALLDTLARFGHYSEGWRDDILAIEAEARAAVEEARAAIWTANGVNEMIDALDAFEAAIRAAALDEARAAVLAQQPTPFAVLGGWDYRVASAAAIDALRRDEG